ncbi:dihydrofolate reductase family protein [Fimbriimonas ginsengisoli]|uniref:Dihydrofolate reductase n=1 Tax=Fimbriimonas ginsengisoli Gsoil 348 TaxID=661478 RepID=A0A068NY57_FIMGI|nr:dihydrofolate reductase family protein [Fimbriimonas ginsengisoli]AIE87860.1 Dihydrofolate reductase [Fimbriimonas ginsengisoli Gsoil 348]
MNQMRRLSVFNSVSLDGYFTDASGDMSWAHNSLQDPEWNAFVEGNASGGGVLVFGRVTYEMMASFWPTPQAANMMPVVAREMNARQKVVFSNTLGEASWSNTTLIKGDLVAEMRRLKNEAGDDMVILGSGSIVSQLAKADLIDGFQIVTVPVALGGGRTLFEGLDERLRLKLTKSQAFGNGNVVSTYEKA